MIVYLLYKFLCQHMVDRNKISRSQITMDIFRFMYLCYFPNHRQELVRNWQYEQQVSDKKQELLIIREDSGFTPCIFVGSVLLIILVLCVVFFLFCLSLSCVLCTRCCHCLWTVHSWLSLRFFVTLILHPK